MPWIVFRFSFHNYFSSKNLCAQSSTSPIIGRWDITIDVDGHKVPSWLEVIHSGVRTLVGRFVGPGGSARPISKVNFTDGNMSFSIPPRWENEDKNLEVSGTLNNDNLTGTMIFSNGKTHSWTAVRAPSLKRNAKPVRGKPITLFNGKNLDGWHASGRTDGSQIREC